MGDLLLGWDDELDFNTQFSSQWDSLCHVTSTSGITYNGAKVTQETLDAQSATTENPLPTIDHWHSRGGIVGRGVLIDFKSYFEETTGSAFDNLDGYSITVEEIETVAKHQKVEFKPGDILIVRTGYTELLEKPTPEDFAKMHQRTLAGVLGDEETARWVWNRRIAAVAGDAIAFESMPAINEDGTGDFGKNPGMFFFFLFYFVCWVDRRLMMRNSTA